MKKVDFFPRDYKRGVAADELYLRNRYFETNPVLSEDGASLLSRPGSAYLTTLGTGPVRGMYTEEGSFNGDLFVASYESVYRVNRLLTSTNIFTGLFSPDVGTVNFTSTAPIGAVPEYLFWADGRNLFIYLENGYAKGTLSGTPVNTDVVRIGAMYYRFTSGAVDTGTPAGTLANPWLVAVGLGSVQSFDNLSAALNLSGTAGTQYSTVTTANGEAKGIRSTVGSFVAQATAVGILGNSVITTETGGLSWGAGTMVGGGTPGVDVVTMPEDIGVVDVATINSFVIVIPVQEGEFIGRFYFIEPGETTVDPLNYATAERSPDGINGVEVLGDQFWLPGPGSTEVWYVSNDPINRMQRLQGVVFDRGTWEGTTIAIHDQLIVCDANGAVFQISGGSPKRVSTPDIEEQIRKAIEEQQRYI